MITNNKLPDTYYMAIANWNGDRGAMFRDCGVLFQLKILQELRESLKIRFQAYHSEIPFVYWNVVKSIPDFKICYDTYRDMACLECFKIKDKLIVKTEPIFIQ